MPGAVRSTQSTPRKKKSKKGPLSSSESKGPITTEPARQDTAVATHDDAPDGSPVVKEVLEEYFDTALKICCERFYHKHAPEMIAMEFRNTILRIAEMQSLTVEVVDQLRNPNRVGPLFPTEPPPVPPPRDYWAATTVPEVFPRCDFDTSASKDALREKRKTDFQPVVEKQKYLEDDTESTSGGSDNNTDDEEVLQIVRRLELQGSYTAVTGIKNVPSIEISEQMVIGKTSSELRDICVEKERIRKSKKKRKQAKEKMLRKTSSSVSKAASQQSVRSKRSSQVSKYKGPPTSAPSSTLTVKKTTSRFAQMRVEKSKSKMLKEEVDRDKRRLKQVLQAKGFSVHEPNNNRDAWYYDTEKVTNVLAMHAKFVNGVRPSPPAPAPPDVQP